MNSSPVPPGRSGYVLISDLQFTRTFDAFIKMLYNRDVENKNGWVVKVRNKQRNDYYEIWFPVDLDFLFIHLSHIKAINGKQNGGKDHGNQVPG